MGGVKRNGDEVNGSPYENEEKRRKANDDAREMLRQEFSPANIKLMTAKRSTMDCIPWHWAVFSFNNLNNQTGTCGGVYEIMEKDEIVYISGLPPHVHIRDALNAHFSGNDGLALGEYLSGIASGNWRHFYVRFMPSRTPSEDARLLLRYFQLRNMGQPPRFN